MTGIMQMFVGGSYSSAPVNTVAPVVTGTTTFGQTLSCSTGTWTGLPAPTFTYQWFRSPSTSIGGATSNTYTLVSADVGNTLYCRVTATNVKGAVNANSNTTATISAVVPSAPTIGTATATGLTTATVSYTASSSNGGATITSYTAVSSPGGITGSLATSGSGTITVSGLSLNTSYTFTVYATNSAGNSPSSSASNSITTFKGWLSSLSSVLGNTFAKGLVLDSSQNIYIACNVATTNEVLFKLNSAGTIQFDVRHLPASGSLTTLGLGIDSSANTYVLSVYDTYNWGLTKYNSSGTKQWFRSIDPGPYLDTPKGVFADSSGQTYLTGWDNESGITTYTAPIVKVNSSGSTNAWARYLIDLSSYYDQYGEAVTADSSGNVYIVGWNNNPRWVIAKYNSSGTLQWTTQISTVYTCRAYAVVTDSSGNVFVTGFVNNASSESELYLMKFNTSGTLQFQRKISYSGNNLEGNKIVVDSSGNIYVAGTVNLTSGGGQYLIAKYDSSGTIQWQRTLSQSTAAVNTVGGIAVDNLGSYYITGRMTAGSIYAGTGRLPVDGSGTGTYTVGTMTLVYASSSFTTSTPTLSAASSTLTSNGTTWNNDPVTGDFTGTAFGSNSVTNI